MNRRNVRLQKNTHYNFVEVSRTLTLRYACLFSFSVPVNFSLAFHNCERNLIARSQNGDSSEIVRRHILLERRYLLFSGDIFLWFYSKESGIITLVSS